MDMRRAWMRWAAATLLLGLNLFQAAAADDPSSMEPGQKALADQAWDTAIAEFSKVIEAEPNNAKAYRQRAVGYIGAEKPDRAVADLSKAIELDPADALSYRYRAVTLWGQDEHDRALADFKEAIRLNPSDAQTYAARGGAYLSSEEHDAAIDDYSNALSIDPKWAEAYAYRGIAFLNKKAYDATIRDCDEALRIDPDCLDAHMGRGLALLNKGEPKTAGRSFSEALRIDPNCAGAYLRRGQARHMQGDYDASIADYSETLRLDPDRLEAYCRRSIAYNNKGQYESAIADLDAVVCLEPNSPCLYEWRAALALEHQDYERGTADLETAIRLNPADHVAHFEAWPKHPVDDADLEHGRQQVRQMLQDRPAMAQYEEKADVFCQWAARKFAGEDLGQRVFWSAAEPEIFPSVCHPPTPSDRAWIQLRRTAADGPEKGQERSFADLWACAVFELYNVSHAADFRRIDKDAAEGRLSKGEYVTKSLACESQAAEQARAFYVRMFLPWAKEHRVSTHPNQWFVACRLDPSDILFQGSLDERSPHRRYYEFEFDRFELHTLVQKGEYQKAADLAAEMQARAQTDSERLNVCRMRGYCLLQSDRPVSAIASLDEAIHMDRLDVWSYTCRARAHLQVFDAESAIADCTEAIRLNPECIDAYRLRVDAYRMMEDYKNFRSDLATLETLSGTSELGLDSDEAFSFRQGMDQQGRWQSTTGPYRMYYDTLTNGADGGDTRPNRFGDVPAATQPGPAGEHKGSQGVEPPRMLPAPGVSRDGLRCCVGRFSVCARISRINTPSPRRASGRCVWPVRVRWSSCRFAR